MKKLFSILLLLLILTTTSCSKIGYQNPKITEKLKKDTSYQRIIITSTRLAGRYTIFDDGAKKRFLNKIYKAKDVTTDNELEADFIIDFYDANKKVASYKYIANISEEDKVNLIDEDGNKFHINSDIEDEFIKRIIKKEMYKDASTYYIALLENVISKIQENNSGNLNIYIDIINDTMVTRFLTATQVENVFKSIEKNNINIVDTEKSADYTLVVKTSLFNEDKTESTVTIKNKSGQTQRLLYSGKKNKDKFEFHIKYK